MSKYFRKTFTYDGVRHQVYGKTLAEAVEKMVERKTALQRGKSITGGNMTVDMWYREWKALYKDNAGITAKSLGAYDEKYVYLKPIARMKLKDVRDIHLQKILNTQAGMSYSHVTKLRNLMKQLFSRARKARLIMWDPSEDLTLPANSRKSHRAITEQEREAILTVAQTHPSGLWILTMLYAGLRPGEAFALQWKDVDFERNELHITKALESGTGTVKPPKTQAGIRDVPIHQDLCHHLLKAVGEPFVPVFPTRAGNYQNANSISRLWKSFKRALDIHLGATTYRNKITHSMVAEDLTPYCLRHTFCSDLEAAGVPINVAKVLMGHSDITVTANIYTHKNQSVLHENIAKLHNNPTFAKNALC